MLEIKSWLMENLSLELSHEKLALLQKHMELVLHANESLNLTAITDRNDFTVKHIIDSMTLVPFIPKNCELVDVGTGAGFPGVVLKIVCDQVSLTLLEAKRKKADFLQEALRKLELEAKVIHGRSEELARTDVKRFDVVTARAVGRIDKLVKSSFPLVKAGGVLLAMKGPDVASELEKAQGVIKRYGGLVEDVTRLTLPGGYGRTVVAISAKGDFGQ